MVRSALVRHGMRPSVGRTRSCFDNTVAESFFATLKTETGTTVCGPLARLPDGTCSPISATTTTTVYIRHSTTGPHTRSVSVIVRISPSWHETPVSGSWGQPQCRSVAIATPTSSVVR